MARYMENEDGVHLMRGEYTLCGDAIDINSVDDAVSNARPTTKRTVTCVRCVDIIQDCRHVRVALSF